MALLQVNSKGIYCPEADVYLDPWRPVARALISHGHADHARWGHKKYICTHSARPVIEYRLPEAKVSSVAFGEALLINGVRFSFHPAGHVVGSAQIRVEHRDEVWVFTGDFKTQSDPISEDFEPVRCQHLITECTFGLPVFRWPDHDTLSKEVNRWWLSCQEEGVVPLLGVYSLGKAQRVLSMLDPQMGPILTHGAVENTNEVLRQQGVDLPPTERVEGRTITEEQRRGIVLCPPSAMRSSWAKKFRPFRTAMASGWMASRGNRRRRNMDRGFLISDHADWQGLIDTVDASGAEEVLTTHGYSHVFARYLREEMGVRSRELRTEYGAEEDGGRVEN
jgi:putative mRNA 3-end processing factor